MARFRFSLFPRTGRFYDLFADLARLLVAASEAMVDLLEHFEDVDAKSARIKELEHQADNITHDIYTLVNQTFVTPWDREDIAALAQRMDDVMDFIEASTTSIQIYGISRPTAAARGLAELTRLQCVQVASAVDLLRNKRNLKHILNLAMEINRLENEGDNLFLKAIAELFESETPAVEIIKWREIYDELESSIDSCENVSHILEAIVLKHG